MLNPIGLLKDEDMVNITTDPVYGFKVFEKDWTCRGFQYEVGKTYILDELPILCARGFHFCLKPKHCFRYYNPENKIKMAIVKGTRHTLVPWTESIDSKCVTNNITIIADITEQAMNILKYYGLFSDWIDVALREYALPIIQKDKERSINGN